MSETRIISAAELFLKIGATPRTRSVKADQLFRKLREGDAMGDRPQSGGETRTNARKSAPLRLNKEQMLSRRTA